MRQMIAMFHRSVRNISRAYGLIFLFGLLCAVIGVVFIGDYSVSNACGQQTSAVQKWALLIGINDYKQSYINDLSGCVNDVRSMYDILVSGYQFDRSHIDTLVNQQATTDNIREAVKHRLLNNSAIMKDDIIVIYYSGHGSQRPDKDGDEADYYDETIVPYDAEPGVSDITDDEINGWVTELSKKTTNLTLIFDSCHSGSATRDPYSAVRYTPPQTGVRGTRGNDGNRSSDWTHPDTGYTFISGSLHYENSHEFIPDDEVQYRGVLSYYLQKVLTSGHQRLTYGDLVAEIQSGIDGTRFKDSQHPVVEGDIDKEVLSGQRLGRQPFSRVVSVNKDKVVIDAGRVQAMTAGSILGVYPPEVRDFAKDANCVAKLIVEKINSTSSLCRIAAPTDSLAACLHPGEVAKNFKVAELQHDYGKLVLPVEISSVKNPKRLKLIKKAFGDLKLPFIRFTSIDSAEVIFSAKGDSIYGPLVGSLCQKVFKPESEGFASQLETAMLRLAQMKNLSQLDNPGSSLSLGAEILNVTVDSAGKTVETVPLTRAEGQDQLQLAVGDRFKIKVTNDSMDPVWVAILDMRTDNGIEALYPIRGARDNEIPPKGSMEIPSRGRFRVTGPLGIEKLKVIGTSAWTSLAASTVPGCASDSIRSRREVKAPSSPLERLLAHPLVSTRSEHERETLDDWTAVTIRFEIVEGGKPDRP